MADSGIVLIPADTVLVCGTGGYTISRSDFDNLRFILPDGWVADFDPTGAIRVSNPSGIGDVIGDVDSAVYDVYNLRGIKVGTSDNLSSLPAGIYIINGKKVSLGN